MARSLEVFGGALLADAVGLGKTYVSLAVASRYRRTMVAVPAALSHQWHRTGRALKARIIVVSHESLSRDGLVPPAELVIVDEAHRFRNASTRRYDRLARGIGGSHLLLVTATPVVNHPSDLVNLLRLFLPDHALSILGAPSLESMIGAGSYADLANAIAPLVVARSGYSSPRLASLLPSPVNDGVVRIGTLSHPALTRLMAMIDGLEFPGFDAGEGRWLMHRHLLYRLASSTAAFAQTVRRHGAYVDRALTAAAGGQPLTRRDARRIFGADEDPQLGLDLCRTPVERMVLDRRALSAERDRLAGILTFLREHFGINPKAARLAQILRARGGRKTLVFAVATATVLDLAHRLAWGRIAVVAGGRGWIASGRIPVAEALSLFAPTARRANPPPAHAAVTTLIATDVASEGLDLQDADGVIHYDLPWTPLRLVQRLGRIARLGSTHRQAHVWWFPPPKALDARLKLEARIRTKVEHQLRLGVPSPVPSEEPGW